MKKVIIFNIFVVSSLFLALELSLRFFFKINPQGISEGIINTEISKVRFNNENVVEGKIFGERVFTDKNGFRITEKKSGESNNNQDIYFVGGSVTFGSGIKQSKTFSGILDDRFKNLNIHNSSVMGSNLKNNYSILKTKVKKEKLKKVFINFSFDDIENIQIVNIKKDNTNSLKKTSLVEKLKNIKFFKNINHFMRSKSVIYVWIKGTLFNSGKHYYQNALNSFESNEDLNQMKLVLDRIHKMNQDLENKISFIIIPYHEQIQDSNCSFQDAGEKIIINELKKRNFDIINFKPVFCNDKDRKDLFLKLDPSHLSEIGHRKVADYLETKLIK